MASSSSTDRQSTIDLALAIEHPGDGVGGAEVAAAARELVADLGDRARRVVGERLDHERDAAGSVALVHDLTVLDAFELAGALLDRALDVVLGHRRRPRVLDRSAEARVAVRVTAALLGGDRDLADELREMRAALRVGRGFVVLDLLPLAVAGHGPNIDRPQFRDRVQIASTTRETR